MEQNFVTSCDDSDDRPPNGVVCNGIDMLCVVEMKTHLIVSDAPEVALSATKCKLIQRAVAHNRSSDLLLSRRALVRSQHHSRAVLRFIHSISL